MKRLKILVAQIIIAIFALIFSSVSFAFASNPHIAKLKETISKLETANPKKDLEKAIKQGDWRFIGILGYSTIVPGTDEMDQKIIKKYGVRVIEGTSDFLENEYVKSLNEVGEKYATEYNRALLQKIRARAK